MVGECWRTDGHPPRRRSNAAVGGFYFGETGLLLAERAGVAHQAGRSGLRCRRATTPPPPKSRGARQDRGEGSCLPFRFHLRAKSIQSAGSCDQLHVRKIAGHCARRSAVRALYPRRAPESRTWPPLNVRIRWKLSLAPWAWGRSISLGERSRAVCAARKGQSTQRRREMR